MLQSMRTDQSLVFPLLICHLYLSPLTKLNMNRCKTKKLNSYKHPHFGAKTTLPPYISPELQNAHLLLFTKIIYGSLLELK